MSKKRTLLEAYTEYAALESNFEDALDDAQGAGVLGDFRLGYDWYDSSVEIYDVPDDVRLSEAAQRVCAEHGFAIAFVNHKNGWETHYTLTKPLPVDGWRVRYGSKMNPPQERVEVERIPESWTRAGHELRGVVVVPPSGAVA